MKWISILLLMFCGAAWAAEFHIRPKAAGGPTFSQFNWAAVKPGDTVYVRGTHEYGRDFAYLKNAVGAAGVTVRGDWPGDPGVIIGARRIPAGSFTRQADSTYAAKFPYNAPFAWQGEPTGNPKLLRGVASRVDVAAHEGCFWRDPATSTIYVNPYGGAIEDVYSNWVGGLYINGKSDVTVKGPKLYGGAGNDGVIRLTKGQGEARNITIEGCEIGFGCYAGIYAAGANTSGVIVRGGKIHSCMTGTYTVGCVHAGWMFDGVEVTGGGEGLDPIFIGTDRQALGGQNMRNLTVQNCNIHDWPGDGVIDYCLTGALMDNVIVLNNRFHNLNDARNLNYHFGVAKHGTNFAEFDQNTAGWVIAGNTFTEIGGNPALGLGIGAALRLKGTDTKVSGNIFYHCNYGMFLSAATSGNIGATVKGNVSLSPAVAHTWVYPFAGTAALDLSGNFYTPGTWKWRNAAMDWAGWQAQMGERESFLIGEAKP